MRSIVTARHCAQSCSEKRACTRVGWQGDICTQHGKQIEVAHDVDAQVAVGDHRHTVN
jgi:hypothetical protein